MKIQHLFSSPELQAQVSFSEYFLSGVSLSTCLISFWLIQIHLANFNKTWLRVSLCVEICILYQVYNKGWWYRGCDKGACLGSCEGCKNLHFIPNINLKSRYHAKSFQKCDCDFKKMTFDQFKISHKTQRVCHCINNYCIKICKKMVW